ncbi:hypothetical protein [Agromyces aerolatus]|uniref:hypothetical protein n=1 Tax=Agromyces sp. LY-1074 TaxID=3074080 RepID=UPI0028578743|nr:MULTISPECIES: hypothetical protein [unclassified Agromyces]MDR5698309.1 hypothetical protein [Agromyces sp. LY-1074]MDR5704603.1 hypothetical protein [Agromyces sp. LY-1358]
MGTVSKRKTNGAVHLVHASFATEEAVYGVLLVAGMIIVAGGYSDSSWTVFTTVIATVFVFWAAHVYAGTVAHHGLEEDRVTGLREAFRMSLQRSLGLLTSALIPSLILLFGATRVVDDTNAIWAALWVSVLVLFVLGYIGFTRRGASWPWRILGALGTAAFGFAMIALKAIVH